MIIRNGNFVTHHVDGVLLVGDPHLSSVRPGRRIEENWPDPIFKKLEFAVDYANKNNLLLVFLGDLFDRPVEEENLKVRLIRLLKQATHRPITNVGNHDISHRTLSDQDSLSTLGESDILDVAADVGHAALVHTPMKTVMIDMVPYGYPIPASVEKKSDHDLVMVVTHHDLAFGDTYPGAINPPLIANCSLAVNGHIHARKNFVKVGETLWINPGNVTRLNVDEIDNMPKIWHIDQNFKSVDPVSFEYHQSPFDLTGRLISAHDKDQTENSNRIESAFVSILEQELSTEVKKSSDGSLLLEEIIAKFEREKTPDDIRAEILELHTISSSRLSA